MTELPKIISVDDHVVEPPHVWQERLPARMREKGPRVERARWGDFSLDVGATYKQEMTDDGRWGDYWVYEDRVIYVHKRHVANLYVRRPARRLGYSQHGRILEQRLDVLNMLLTAELTDQ